MLPAVKSGGGVSAASSQPEPAKDNLGGARVRVDRWCFFSEDLRRGAVLQWSVCEVALQVDFFLAIRAAASRGRKKCARAVVWSS